MSFPSAARPWALAGALGAAGACASASRLSAPASPTVDARTLEIAAFGDSLTSGHGIGQSRAFPAVLQQYLEREGLPFRMVNAGISGDTTTSALPRLPSVLARRPAIVIIALGANDGLRGVPVPTVKANLSRAIRHSRESGARVLLCAMEALPLTGWDYTVDFHRAYADLAREHDVALVPFFMAAVIGRRDLLLDDRIHPNAEGARVIAETVWPHLEPMARALAP
jgi:acyl-CoA thioesterase-1